LNRIKKIADYVDEKIFLNKILENSIKYFFTQNVEKTEKA